MNENLTGSQYTMLSQMEMIDTLSNSMLYDEIQLLIGIVNNIVDTNTKYKDNATGTKATQVENKVFVFRREIDTHCVNLNRFWTSSITTTCIQFWLSEYLHMNIDGEILWFAATKENSTRVKDWIKGMDEDYDENGSPTCLCARKFLMKFGFDASCHHNKVPAMRKQFQRLYSVTQQLRVTVYNEKKTSYHKIDQINNFYKTMIQVLVNIQQGWKRDVDNDDQRTFVEL